MLIYCKLATSNLKLFFQVSNTMKPYSIYEPTYLNVSQSLNFINKYLNKLRYILFKNV